MRKVSISLDMSLYVYPSVDNERLDGFSWNLILEFSKIGWENSSFIKISRY
jgi:hypothetical protein